MGLQARLTATKPTSSDEEKLPLTVQDDSGKDYHHTRKDSIANRLVIAALFLTLAGGYWLSGLNSALEFPFPKSPAPVPDFVKEGIKQCEAIARPPPKFSSATEKRKSSDRFVKGTSAVWLKNGTVWTGEEDGEEILYGADILLDGGVIRKIGKGEDVAQMIKGDVEEVDLHGAWVTPGIVDMHSHMGVGPSPGLRGTEDTNSLKSPVLPWLRSVDAFKVHDASFNLSIAGGITTMLVLPGSAGNIGGQAFTFKPRTTYENTPASMQVAPPYKIVPGGNGSWERTENWRHMKHACGENAHRVYDNTRLDSAWDFRKAYNEGKKLKVKQDRWCASPRTQTEPFPEDLQWEVMADILRGNVKVNIHCYTTVDLTDMVRISNEFEFPIAAFHHAHETYLVPDLLKQAWGPEPPAVAIFATNQHYKAESYHGSEFAPKVLSDAGIRVSMKSDHPVLDSRFLVYEAAQAHHYGLNYSYALASVTTASAKSIGLDHRLGYIKPGYDADIVVWDSFPLSLGATPKQTYIDGIAQIINPHVTEKPSAAQQITKSGDYTEEIKDTLLARGDPDLRPKKKVENVIFQGVSAMYLPGQVNALSEGDRVVVRGGEIVCTGACANVESDGYDLVDLKGGSISPGLVTVGSPLGMAEIIQEASTQDGPAYDPTSPAAQLEEGLIVRGVDGVSFGGKDTLQAYRSGVTTAISAPMGGNRLFAGLSFAWSTGGEHALAPNAIQDPSLALHLSFATTSKTSTSAKIATIRRLLSGQVDEKSELTETMKQVAKGERRLVVEVFKGDIMAALVRLKREVAPDAKITFLGGHESWMVAEDLAKDNIAVIVAPARSFPTDWDSRRILPGPPITNQSLPAYLHSRGVTVGLGIVETWQARNVPHDAAWVYANNPEVFSKQDAIDLVSTNLETLFGRKESLAQKDWVAWEGDMFSIEGRVRAVRSVGSETIDLL